MSLSLRFRRQREGGRLGGLRGGGAEDRLWLAFANCYLVANGVRIVRASAIFAISGSPKWMKDRHPRAPRPVGAGHRDEAARRAPGARRVFRAATPSYMGAARQLEAHAERLTRMASDVGPAHFIGHSLGGLVVLEALNRHPEIAAGRVVLLGTPARGCYAGRRIAAIRVGRWFLGQSESLWREWHPESGRECRPESGREGRGGGAGRGPRRWASSPARCRSGWGACSAACRASMTASYAWRRLRSRAWPSAPCCTLGTARCWSRRE